MLQQAEGQGIGIQWSQVAITASIATIKPLSNALSTGGGLGTKAWLEDNWGHGMQLWGNGSTV